MKRPIAHALFGLMLASLAVSASAQITHTVGAGPAAGATIVDFGGSNTSFNNSTAVETNLPATNYSGATFTGGNLYDPEVGISGVAARPAGAVGNFWAIGPSQKGTVTFAAPVSYYGFLWGSPDPGAWNQVTFFNGTTKLAAFGGSVTSLGNAWSNSIYFSVSTNGGPLITSVAFTASSPAFETAKHSYITAVSEPESYAMLLAGLGLIGGIVRRRMSRQS